MPKKRRSFPFFYTFLFLVAAATGAYFYFFKPSTDKTPEFLTTSVSKGDITQSVTATGDLDPVISVDVSSQISGLIKEVLVDFNTPVKKGDVLARIDPATYESRLSQAKADLSSTQANNTLVRLNTERSRELRAKQLISQQDLDQAEALLAQSKAQLLTREAAVKNAEVDLARCTITSPIDGIVIDRIAEVGKTVSASTSAPTLFTIVNDLSQMRILAAVAEADIGQIEVDQPVNFTVDAYPNRQFRGKVTLIRNSAKNQQSVVTYLTQITVRNEDLRLKPGMTANVSIVIANRPGTLKIANAALRARIPETLLPAKASPTVGTSGPLVRSENTAAPSPEKTEPAKRPPGSGQPGDSNASRAKMMALMQEHNIDPRSGPPSPEAAAKFLEAAKAQGIEIPERLRTRLEGGGNTTRPTNATTTRTLYKLTGTAPDQKIEPVSVKLGITDGTATEIIEGLAEGDLLITSVIVPGAPATTAGPSNNPFNSFSGSSRSRR